MPQDSGIYINRGDAYRELKKFNLALSDYHYAMDLGGDQKMIKARLSLTHYALGSQCFNQKDYEGANIEYSRVSLGSNITLNRLLNTSEVMQNIM